MPSTKLNFTKNDQNDRESHKGRRNRENDANLGILLSEEKKYMQKLYQDIGEEYVRIFKDQYHDKLKEKVDLVNESMNRLKEYRNPLPDSFGKNLCPNCGAEVNEKAMFCSMCGSRIERESSRNTNVCPSCHAPLGEDDRFCMACGQSIERAAVKKIGKKCPRCNAKIIPEASFCMICGLRLGISDHMPVMEDDPDGSADGHEWVFAGQETRQCPYCGTELSPDEMFCIKCGKRYHD